MESLYIIEIGDKGTKDWGCPCYWYPADITDAELGREIRDLAGENLVLAILKKEE